MNYRIEDKEAFRIVGIKKRVPIVFQGVNPEIASMFEGLTPEMIDKIKGFSNV
ncbi:AraC family transcriptional regulator [Paenibacillus macquariensis]|uniref:AraC family transcriptional regulator n=3 Tax=Paenibacillus macquariensis TaxID=948756 RepID=A0ABY1KHL4_9BACL|nr:AraC family transcriptional regulator [Paenibacillus macquariensis]